jgi:outer membrane receptor for ferrienterochelin and colicins
MSSVDAQVDHGRLTFSIPSLRRSTAGILSLLSLISAPALAADGSPQCAPTRVRARDVVSLDLESLLNIKVITASRFSETQSEAPGVISVVSRDELNRFGGNTLREVLERVPSLAATSAYFTDRSMVAARGDQTKIDGGHVLFLINGRPTREILEGGVISDLLESFPVSILERVEVIKGPGSVLYGSNAFSAVVNLITQEADGNGLVLTGLGGQGGAMNTSGQAMYTCGDLSIVAAAQFHQKPEWATTYRFPDALIPDPLGSGAVSRLSVTIPDRGPGGYLGVNYKGLALMSSFTELDTSSFVRGAVGVNRWRRGFADLGYSWKASDHWDSSVNLTYTRTTLHVPDFPTIGRDSREFLLEWTNSVSVSARDRLTVGALYDHIQGEEDYFGITPSIAISKGSRPGYASYAQLNHRLLDNLKLVGGVQANKIGHIDLAVVPRAGVIWNPASGFTVKGLYGEAFRAPSINETLLNHPGLAGNADLKPERVGTFDIGVSYAGEHFQAGANYFRSKQTDSIVVDSSTPRWRYRNLGEATFHGLELEAKYYVKKALFLQGSMLYQANKDGNGTKNVTPISNRGAKAGVSYEAANGFTAGLFDVYQGPINGYAASVNPRPVSSHLLNAHLRLDLSRYMRAGATTGIALVAHADNLANKEIWLPEWGGNSGDTIPVHGSRTLYFGVEVSLNKAATARVGRSAK